MMRFNLIPEAQRQQRRRQYRSSICRGGTVVGLGAILVLLPVLTYCYLQAAGERQYITDVLLPAEADIQRHNQEERKVQALAAAQEARRKEQIIWSHLLVSLAETKPVEITLEKITGQGQTLVLTGHTPDIMQARQWQQRLQKQPGITKVQLKTTKQPQDKHTAVSWEVYLGQNEAADGTTASL